MKRKNGAACSQAASEVMHSLPRARTRVVGLGSSPTEILKESLLDLPRTRARGGTKPQSDFAAWRVKTFGGDFDPVRIAGRGSLSVRCKGGRVCAEWLAVVRACPVRVRAWGVIRLCGGCGSRTLRRRNVCVNRRLRWDGCVRFCRLVSDGAKESTMKGWR